MSDSFSCLQAILGTDKNNPMFAVYRDEQKRELHVYYGFELLEVVPDDKTSPRFIGRNFEKLVGTLKTRGGFMGRAEPGINVVELRNCCNGGPIGDVGAT
jgi:hypothetical protein